MKKRMICLLVCLTLLFGVLPFGAFADNTIQKIALSGYMPPIIGKTAGEMVFTTKLPDNVPYTAEEPFWYCDTDGNRMATNEVFEAGKVYSCSWTIVADEGYTFDANAAVTINGDSSLADASYTTPADESCKEFYVWTLPAPALREISEISVTGYTVPSIGQTAGDNLASIRLSDSAPYTLDVLYWYNVSDGRVMADDEAFAEDKTYFIHFEVKPKAGYTFFRNTPIVYINGSTENADADWTTVKSNGNAAFYTTDYTLSLMIAKVGVNGFVLPEIGQTAGENLASITLPDGAPYTLSMLYWYNDTDNRQMADNEVFEEGKTYFIHFEAGAKEGYAFNKNDLTAFINDSAEYVDTMWTEVRSDGIAVFYTLDMELAPPITQVKADGVNLPKLGQTAGENLATVSLPEDAPYTFRLLYWYNSTDDHSMADDEVFEADKTYYIHFDVVPTPGNAFAEDEGPVLINGSTELVDTVLTEWKIDYVTFFTVDIELIAFIYGDVNSDGTVNKKDSLALKKYLADNTNVIDRAAADVNVDGFVNKKDSLRLKQYLAGWAVTLGA